MRFVQLHALLLLAGLVAASDQVIANARVRAAAPEPTPVLHSLDRRWCFLFICFGTTTTTTTSTTIKPTTTASSRSPTPTVISTSSTPAVTSSSLSGASSANVASSITASPTTTSSTYEQTSTSWSYSQPPLPAKTVSAPAAAFTMAEGLYPPLWATTRAYYLTLDYATGWPSGFHRRIMAVNNQYPAPIIEGWEGDTLRITVTNKLDHPQAIHWHGMRQNGTNSEDGIPGVTQCSIPAGGSYTYVFNLNSGEMGTYWYHSHYANTLADGLTGMLVVHSRKQPMKLGRDYDSEIPMYLTDWMHDQSETIAHGLLNMAVGYRGSGIPPFPDAILLNGVGQSDCSAAQAGVKCITTAPPVTKAVVGSRVRMRLVNMGAHATIRFTIDKHTLTLVEIDDTPIQPVNLHEVTVAPGQRYSVIVNMDAGRVGSAFWMRATTASGCLGPTVIVTKAILRYTDFLGLTWSGNGIPTTQPWDDLVDPLTHPCLDTDEEINIVPSIREDSPKTAVVSKALNSSFGIFRHPDGSKYIGFGYNDVAFTNYINNPLLSQIQKGLTLNPQHVAALTYDSPDAMHAVDFIINNIDPVGLDHPFHLHGRPFHIVARGKGHVNPEDIPHMQLQTDNPVRRDTLVIGGGHYAVLRIITDNPGVWAVHCHIGWHLAVGKLGVFIIRPDEVRKQQQKAAWSGLCAGTDINEIGPARRGLPPQSRRAYDIQASYKDDLEEEEEEPKFGGGLQDFTPTPEGATRGEYQSNGTHWWVVDTPYAGVIPEDEQVPQKRHWLEARTVFMNETHWWVPGTIWVGLLDKPINIVQEAAATAPESNVVIVEPGMIVPGPGDNLVEPEEIQSGTVVEVPASTFENAIPIGYAPSGPQTQAGIAAPVTVNPSTINTALMETGTAPAGSVITPDTVIVQVLTATTVTSTSSIVTASAPTHRRGRRKHRAGHNGAH